MFNICGTKHTEALVRRPCKVIAQAENARPGIALPMWHCDMRGYESKPNHSALCPYPFVWCAPLSAWPNTHHTVTGHLRCHQESKAQVPCDRGQGGGACACVELGGGQCEPHGGRIKVGRRDTELESIGAAGSEEKRESIGSPASGVDARAP